MSYKNLWILDNGHGGLCPLTQEYLTKGKRSPIWKDKTVYYEGVGNREIARGISRELDKLDIPYYFLVPEYEDIALSERVRRVKAIPTNLNKIVVSIHSNGFVKESANGWEVYTSKGQTKSDEVAKVFNEVATEILGDRFKIRGTKEANFYMLQKHPFTAILTENLFHTNEKDCRFLMSKEGQQEIIKLHVEAIKRYEERF